MQELHNKITLTRVLIANLRELILKFNAQSDNNTQDKQTLKRYRSELYAQLKEFNTFIKQYGTPQQFKERVKADATLLALSKQKITKLYTKASAIEQLIERVYRINALKAQEAYEIRLQDEQEVSAIKLLSAENFEALIDTIDNQLERHNNMLAASMRGQAVDKRAYLANKAQLKASAASLQGVMGLIIKHQESLKDSIKNVDELKTLLESSIKMVTDALHVRAVMLEDPYKIAKDYAVTTPVATLLKGSGSPAFSQVTPKVPTATVNPMVATVAPR